MWPVLLAAVDATRGIEPGTWSGQDQPARPRGDPAALVLPAVLPALMAGMRTALGIALIMMVISEMIASSSGLGYVILQSQRTYAIGQMYAGILVLGVLGWLVTAAFSLTERRVLAWYQDQKGHRP